MTNEQLEENIKDCYINLQRQYDICITGFDRPAQKALAGVLRNWRDMKISVEKYLAAKYPTIKFDSFSIMPEVSNIVRGHEYILAPFPNSVIVTRNAEEFSLASSTAHSSAGRPFSISVNTQIVGKNVRVEHFGIVFKKLSDAENKIFMAKKISALKRLRFIDWCNDLVVRLAIPNEAGVLTTYSITREAMIDRVSNILGGTHPIGNKEVKNDNNWPVKYLMDYQVLDIPLSHIILLKLAQDILERFKNIF